MVGKKEGFGLLVKMLWMWWHMQLCFKCSCIIKEIAEVISSLSLALNQLKFLWSHYCQVSTPRLMSMTRLKRHVSLVLLLIQVLLFSPVSWLPFRQRHEYCVFRLIRLSQAKCQRKTSPNASQSRGPTLCCPPASLLEITDTLKPQDHCICTVNIPTIHSTVALSSVYFLVH